MHGSHDDVVEVSHTHKLYDEARQPKQIIVVDGAGHKLRHNNEAMAAVLDWLESQC